ncbi:trigger factor [Kaistia geumhonensis]|uniref:Trigger factor n=1 Tax=Kaistia geumhonensis TaxID=410839 RepID=A0ABU0M2Z7_9HYPH|nr:trigger factor [Kaistia geumhonensis]MCX5479479.1 trigger factor [Kaistia geumhonensis]MDQ0515297.1 trigger factor [Kaistia geumhonensis]
MQVTETLSEGLKRELKIVVPAADLDSRLSARLEELKGQVRLNGFRPGKVPTAHLRRLYGKSAMAEIVQNILNETARKTLEERGERAAMQPSFALPEDEAEAGEVLDGKKDLSYTMTYEVLPSFELGDFAGIKIDRPIAEVTDEEVDAEVAKLARDSADFATKDGAAENGDRVTISYVGKIDGEPFEGGADENGQVTIGSGRFIPGFEDQLIGAKVGEERVLNVTFPENYGAKHLAGKAATFDVTVKDVAAPVAATVDDEWAKKFGLESLEKLRETMREQMQGQLGSATRTKIKRQLLDKLDELHSFELPPTMVEQEFENVWNQVTQDLQRSGRTFEDENTTEEAAKADYRKIAERRVRLGLVLSEIGEGAKIQVTDEELQRALVDRIRQFPGQEKEVYEFYRSNPEALASLRAPIFEEKVVDHVLGLADITDRTVSREELLKDEEEGQASA